MSYMYSDPEDFGLKMIGEVDFSSGCYCFDYTVVWQRVSDGRFVYGDDSGCSCPSPFEDQGVQNLTVLRKRGGLNDLKAHLEERIKESYEPEERTRADVVKLIELVYAAGGR